MLVPVVFRKQKKARDGNMAASFYCTSGFSLAAGPLVLREKQQRGNGLFSTVRSPPGKDATRTIFHRAASAVSRKRTWRRHAPGANL